MVIASCWVNGDRSVAGELGRVGASCVDGLSGLLIGSATRVGRVAIIGTAGVGTGSGAAAWEGALGSAGWLFTGACAGT